MPKKRLEGTSLGKLVNWLFSVGRYIIVFTELVVIGAFLSRFWLDRRNSDLSEELRQQGAILESITDFEKEFTLFQSRLERISQTLEKEKNPLNSLDLITASLPGDSLLLKYNFTEEEKNEATILALFFSEASLASFVDSLLSKEEVLSVRIGAIERERGASGMKIQFLVTFQNLINNEKAG